MKPILFFLCTFFLVACNDNKPSLPEATKVSDGIWRFEDSDATCFQLYTNSISCQAKPVNGEAKKNLTKEAVKVADGIWKSEYKDYICYQLYTEAIDCIPNLKKD